MKLRIAALAAAGLFGAAAFATPGITAGEHKNQYPDDTATQWCGDSEDGDTVVYGGPLKMWPPNHKTNDSTVTATEGDGNGTVSLATAGTHDEYLEDGTEENGAGNTDNDVNPAAGEDSGNPSATTSHELRAERSGRGDGRTYRIDFVAQWDDKACHSPGAEDAGLDVPEGSTELDPFLVEVPHDMSEKADRDGRTEIGKGGDE